MRKQEGDGKTIAFLFCKDELKLPFPIKHRANQVKLWGVACIFLMISISLGSLYDLISITKPGSLGANLEIGFPIYAECVTYSLSILGDINSELQPGRLIRNISILEAVWGGLCGMLIIGKLLGLPRQEDSETK